MKRRFKLIMIVLPVLFCAIPGFAQNEATAAKTDLWSAMPEVDLIANVNIRRIIVDAIPRILADQPQMSADYTLLLAGVKAETGIDPRAVSRIIIGVRSTGKTFEQQQLVAIAEGTFKYSDVINSFRGERKAAQVREEQYSSHVITIFTKGTGGSTGSNGKKDNEPDRPLGFAELAPGVITFGDPGGVRRAIDAFTSTQNRISADLVSASEGSPESLISMAARVPKDLIRRELGDRPNNRLMKMLLSISLVRARLDLGTSGLPFQFVAATESPESASELRCMTESLRTMAAGALDFYINPPPGNTSSNASSSSAAGTNAKPEVLALRALEGLTIASDGAEVRIQTELPIDVLRSLLKDMGKHTSSSP